MHLSHFQNLQSFLSCLYTAVSLASHGFGLPHTDENPYNTNQGNCLDYTDNPGTNINPGDVNFNKLSGMYLAGNRRTTRRLESGGRVIETHMLVVDWDIIENSGDYEEIDY